MNNQFAITIALLGSATFLPAQNGLRDIPDPDVNVQKASFKLPEGAEINLFASDPMISKPVHMNWDGEGRLWLVSSGLYPHIEPGQKEKDRVLILEDSDKDGAADKVTTFAEDLYIPTGILPGDGGAYIVNSTEIVHLRDTDGDGKSDTTRVMLSGFGTEDTHHLVHTLRWGPEGMVWFNQSIYIHSHVETPYGVRRLLGGGMWHWRPETGRLEVFMKGLVNSWGHAFDDWGQSFMTDGAGGNGINFVFPRSVFVTSPGASRILRGLNPGQPKHCSLEVVTGRHVPPDWVGTLLAPDFRGHRINRFRLTDNGAAYTSTQIEDLVSSTHRAFRPIDVKMGPDGAIYIADWYNPIIQHGEVDFRDPRRDHTHGRIWRVTFPKRELVEFPKIVDAPADELVRLLDSPEGLTRNLATAELRERGAKEIMPALEKWGGEVAAGSDLQRLRLVWASQAVNDFQEGWLVPLLNSTDHRARAAALRALYYEAGDRKVGRSILEKAVSDPNLRVRLWGVSVLAQLDDPDTVALALRALEGVKHDEFLDFAVWSICREHAARWVPRAEKENPFDSIGQLIYAASALNQPVGVAQVLGALAEGKFASDAELGEVANWVAKVGSPPQLEALFAYILSDERSASQKALVLTVLGEAGKLRKLRPSGDLKRLLPFLESTDGRVFLPAATLAGQWKLADARPVLEKAFLGGDQNAARAFAALEGLRSLGGAEAADFLTRTATDENASFQLRSMAVIGRIRMDPAAGATLAVPILQSAGKPEDTTRIWEAVLSNKSGPGALTAALKGQTLRPEIARAGMQKAGSAATKPEGLIAALKKAGSLAPMKLQLTPAEMEAMMTRVAEKGDPHRGEKIYRRTALQCTVCHAIGGVGGIIGPDMVSIGASAPVDYLIESLLEPSKKIKEGYHTTLVTTKTGDAVAGAIAREDEREVVIRDATGKEQRVPKADIAKQTVSPVSLMPPGLTASLREDEFVDLVRFLSELGKEGAFKTTPSRYVRKWEVLQPHERTRDDIGHYGEKIFAEDFKGYVWTPMGAKVNGGLPFEELPQMVGRGKNRFGVGRFFLNVEKAGKVPLKLNGTMKDLHLFVGEEKVALPREAKDAQVILDLKPGRHRITIAGLLGWGLADVRVEVGGEAGAVRIGEAE